MYSTQNQQETFGCFTSYQPEQRLQAMTKRVTDLETKLRLIKERCRSLAENLSNVSKVIVNVDPNIEVHLLENEKSDEENEEINQNLEKNIERIESMNEIWRNKYIKNDRCCNFKLENKFNTSNSYQIKQNVDQNSDIQNKVNSEEISKNNITNLIQNKINQMHTNFYQKSISDYQNNFNKSNINQAQNNNHNNFAYNQYYETSNDNLNNNPQSFNQNFNQTFHQNHLINISDQFQIEQPSNNQINITDNLGINSRTWDNYQSQFLNLKTQFSNPKRGFSSLRTEFSNQKTEFNNSKIESFDSDIQTNRNTGDQIFQTSEKQKIQNDDENKQTIKIIEKRLQELAKFEEWLKKNVHFTEEINLLKNLRENYFKEHVENNTMRDKGDVGSEEDLKETKRINEFGCFDEKVLKFGDSNFFKFGNQNSLHFDDQKILDHQNMFNVDHSNLFGSNTVDLKDTSSTHFKDKNLNYRNLDKNLCKENVIDKDSFTERDLVNENLNLPNSDQNIDVKHLTKQNLSILSSALLNLNREDMDDQNFNIQYFEGKYIDSRNLSKENLNRQNFDNQNVDKENIYIHNIDSSNVDSQNIGIRKNVCQNINSQQMINQNINSHNIDSQNINSKNIDNQNIYNQNMKNRNVDNPNIESRNIEGGNQILGAKKIDCLKESNQKFGDQHFVDQFLDAKNSDSQILSIKNVNSQESFISQEFDNVNGNTLEEEDTCSKIKLNEEIEQGIVETDEILRRFKTYDLFENYREDISLLELSKEGEDDIVKEHIKEENLCKLLSSESVVERSKIEIESRKSLSFFIKATENTEIKEENNLRRKLQESEIDLENKSLTDVNRAKINKAVVNLAEMNLAINLAEVNFTDSKIKESKTNRTLTNPPALIIQEFEEDHEFSISNFEEQFKKLEELEEKLENLLNSDVRPKTEYVESNVTVCPSEREMQNLYQKIGGFDENSFTCSNCSLMTCISAKCYLPRQSSRRIETDDSGEVERNVTKLMENITMLAGDFY